MPVKIRLQRKGRKKRPFYHIVVADSRSPRDGSYIERLGSYNPMTKPATIEIDRDSAFDWLMKGAQPTDTARAILRFKGVLYRKHLQRGVKKGAFSQEDADKLYQDWIDAKEAKVSARFEQTKAEKDAFNKALFGKIPSVEIPVQEEEEANTEEASVEDTATDDAAPAPTPEDLTKIEGIGPKIAETLQNGGITNFAQLAAATPEKIREILDAAEGNFNMHDPATWPEQAQMAADGKWEELQKWQDELDGGKVVENTKEEE